MTFYKTRVILRVLPAAALLFAGGALAAGDKQFVKPDTGDPADPQVCAACHGPNGISTNPTFPHLAGQYRDYLLQALRAYKNGERNNPIMMGQVANLSDQALQDLAKFYSEQEGPLYTPAIGQ